MPERDLVADLAAADSFLAGDQNMISVVQAFKSAASPIPPPISSQWAASGWRAIISSPPPSLTAIFMCKVRFNDVNDYAGPGTGYRVENGRWEEIQRIPQANRRLNLSPTKSAHRWKNWQKLARPNQGHAKK